MRMLYTDFAASAVLPVSLHTDAAGVGIETRKGPIQASYITSSNEKSDYFDHERSQQ